MNDPSPRKRRALRQRTAALTAAALGGALLAVPGTAAAQAAEIDCGAIGERPSAYNIEGALEIAVACGVEVVIDRASTVYDSYTATPEGQLHQASTVTSASDLQEQGLIDASLVESEGTLVQADSPWSFALRNSDDAAQPLIATIGAELFWDGAAPLPDHSGNTAAYTGLAPGLDLAVSAAGKSVALDFTVADVAAWDALASGMDFDGYISDFRDGLYLKHVGTDDQDGWEEMTRFIARDAEGTAQSAALALDADDAVTLSLPNDAVVFPLTVHAQWNHHDIGANEWGAVTSAAPDLSVFEGDAGLDEPYFEAAGETGTAVVGAYCDTLADPECAAPATGAAYWNFWGPIVADVKAPGIPGTDFLRTDSAFFRVDAAEGTECTAPPLTQVTPFYRAMFHWSYRPLAREGTAPITGACQDGTAVYDITAAGLYSPNLGMTGGEETARFDGASARVDIYSDIIAFNYSLVDNCPSASVPAYDWATVSYGVQTADLWRPDLIDLGMTWSAVIRKADTGEVVAESAPKAIVDGTNTVKSTSGLADGDYTIEYEVSSSTMDFSETRTCHVVVDTSAPEITDITVEANSHLIGGTATVKVTVADEDFPDGRNTITITCSGADCPAARTVVLMNGTTAEFEVKLNGISNFASFTVWDKAINYGSTETVTIPASYDHRDFDGDGRQDVVTVAADGDLVLHGGNGDGTLDDGVELASGWGSMDVVMAGDLTGDGAPDLLARDAKTGTLYTYPGDGEGGLDTRITVGAGWNAMRTFTSAGDFDQNGRLDLLALTEADSKMYFYPGKGDGTFGARSALPQDIYWDQVDTISSFGSFDNGDDPDLLARDARTGEYTLYMGQPGVTFSSYSQLTPPSLVDEDDATRYREIVTAGDLDEDGHDDLVGIDTRTGALVMHSFDYDSNPLHGGVVVDTAWGGEELAAVRSDQNLDFDGDGASDILARSSSTGTTYLYTGSGSGGFGPQYNWGTGLSGLDLLETAGDFTGDNFADLLGRTSGGVLYVYPGDGAGGYDPAARIRIGGGWDAMNAIVGGQDYNGDGKTDIIARETATGNLWFYPGTGAGGLGTRALIGTGWNSLALITAVGDLDHDGVADVLGKKSADDCLYMYAGEPGGGLKNGVKIGCGWDVMNAVAAVGDFNGDGHVDWVARLKSNGALYLYKGNGVGSYSASVVIGTGWNGLFIA